MSKKNINPEHKVLLTVKEASRLFNVPEKYIYLDAYKNRNRRYLIWNNYEPLIKRKYFDLDICDVDINNFRWDIRSPFFILDCFSDILFSDNYYIYFITDGEFVKIGYASNIKERICALQIGNARRLRCLFSIGVKDEKSALLLETFLHNIYQDMHQLGEWFDILNYIDLHKFKIVFSDNGAKAYLNIKQYSRDIQKMKLRKDNRGRNLYLNESQKKDGSYRLTLTIDGERRNYYSWKLEPDDIVPVGKRNKKSIREIEWDLGIYY